MAAFQNCPKWMSANWTHTLAELPLSVAILRESIFIFELQHKSCRPTFIVVWPLEHGGSIVYLKGSQCCTAPIPVTGEYKVKD